MVPGSGGALFLRDDLCLAGWPTCLTQPKMLRGGVEFSFCISHLGNLLQRGVNRRALTINVSRTEHDQIFLFGQVDDE